MNFIHVHVLFVIIKTNGFLSNTALPRDQPRVFVVYAVLVDRLLDMEDVLRLFVDVACMGVFS